MHGRSISFGFYSVPGYISKFFFKKREYKVYKEVCSYILYETGTLSKDILTGIRYVWSYIDCSGQLEN
jgi:hypothetical protein